MSFRLIAFSAWCLTMFSASVSAAYYAWSPFSDDDRGAVAGVRGPTHK